MSGHLIHHQPQVGHHPPHDPSGNLGAKALATGAAFAGGAIAGPPGALVAIVGSLAVWSTARLIRRAREKSDYS